MIGKPIKSKHKLVFSDADVDLVPMIDCIFLILLFFMLCGRITLDQRAQQITPPPTKTGTKPPDMQGWQHFIINVYGKTKEGHPPRNTIEISKQKFESVGIDNYEGYQKLRAVLDEIYNRADKVPDDKQKDLMLPKVVLEIRADADTEYRVVQEVEQVVSDSIDPFNGMKPKAMDFKLAKPFVYLLFTTRLPGDK